MANDGAQDYLAKDQISRSLIVRSIQYAIQRKQVELDLKQKILELEKYNALAIEREKHIIELKKQVNDLHHTLQKNHLMTCL